MMIWAQFILQLINIHHFQDPEFDIFRIYIATLSINIIIMVYILIKNIEINRFIYLFYMKSEVETYDQNIFEPVHLIPYPTVSITMIPYPTIFFPTLFSKIFLRFVWNRIPTSYISIDPDYFTESFLQIPWRNIHFSQSGTQMTPSVG